MYQLDRKRHWWQRYWDLMKRRDGLSHYFDSDEGRDVRAMVQGVLPATHRTPIGRHYSRHNTELAYTADQRTYVQACLRAGIDPNDPPLEWRLAFFEQYAVGKRFSTVSRLEAAVANYMYQSGKPSFTRTFSHRQLMRRLARQDRRVARKARALYGVALKRLLHSYDPATDTGLRDLAMMTAAAIRAFRAASIVSIHLEDLRFEADGLLIALRNEKTASGNEPLYAATPHSATHEFCMPCVFRKLVDRLALVGISDGPLFRHIDRWGNLSESALTPKSVTLILREGLRKAGVPEPQSYSSHSLRHGVVAAAIERGYSDREIMLLTMHRSLKGLRAYTSARDPWREAPKHLPLDDCPDESESESEQHGWRHEP